MDVTLSVSIRTITILVMMTTLSSGRSHGHSPGRHRGTRHTGSATRSYLPYHIPQRMSRGQSHEATRGPPRDAAGTEGAIPAGLGLPGSRTALRAAPPTSPPLPDREPGSSRRTRRSADLLRPVCQSVSAWTSFSTAEDIHGNVVHVAQQINTGGAVVDQYFYVTRCAHRHHSGQRKTCTGVDTSRYTSQCLEKHVWTYAKARDAYGLTAWTQIRIPASCNCGIRQRGESMDFW